MFDTTLSSPAVIGAVFHALEGITDNVTQKLAGTPLPMDEVEKKLAGITSPDGLREWDGPRVARRAMSINWALRSKKFESTFAIDVDDLRRDKTGFLDKRINGEFRDPVSTHWLELITAKLEAGTTAGTCYDGAAYFSTSHSEGVSGNQKNLHSIDIATVTAPTAAEFEGAIWDVLSSVGTLKNDKGRPVVVPNDITVMIPPTFWKAASIALGAKDNSQIINTASGYTQTLSVSGFTMTLTVNPFLQYASGQTWEDAFVIFLNNERAFIRGTELPGDIEAGAIGPDTPHAFLTDEIMVGIKTIRALETFDWRSAHMVQFI